MTVSTTQNVLLLNGATTNKSAVLSMDGFIGAQAIEIQETAGGTVTVAITGSFDGTTFYAVGYQQVDNTASPSRAVANISVLANSKHVYQILDPYPQLEVTLSSISSATVNVRVYGIAG